MFKLKLSISFISLRIKSNFPNITYKVIHDLALANLLRSPSLTNPSHSTFCHTEFPLRPGCARLACGPLLMLFFLKLSGHSFPSLFSNHLYPSLFPSLFHDLCFIHHHDHDCESCSVLSDSLWPHGLNSPWNSLGQNTRVSSLSHLQGIFPT